jgi:carboxymethylenebutenolidase
MATKVEFKAKSGAAASGELGLPEGTGKAPALVLVQEWHGINDHIRSLVDRFAKEGFLVLAPDLYHGVVAKDDAEAGKLMTELDGKRAMDDIAGAAAYLLAHPRANGKVGITGFCMGGAYAFAATSAIPEIAAAVPFYGVPPMERLDFTKMKAPILAHFALHDQWATVAKAEEIKKGIDAQHGSMRLEVYDANHAFMRDSDAKAYAPEAAKVAWGRTLEFLHKYLG